MSDQCKPANFMLGTETVSLATAFFFGMKNGWEGDYGFIGVTRTFRSWVVTTGT